MSIVVHYDNSADREAAEQIANFIDNTYDFSSFTVSGGTIEYSSFDGVLIVGGQNANSQYEKFLNRGDFPELKCNTNDDLFDFDGAAADGVVTDIFLYQETPVQGLAGCTAENTSAGADWYIGEASAQQLPFTSLGAGVDEFIERVKEQKQDKDDVTVEDPSDPTFEPEDPDSDEREKNWKDMIIKRPRQSEGQIVSELKEYEFVVSGLVEEGTETEDHIIRQSDKVTSPGHAQGSIGVAGTDSWKITGDIEDFSYDGNDDIQITIRDNGESKDIKYESDTGDLREGETVGQKEAANAIEAFAQAVKKPFATPENTARFAVLVLLLLVISKSLGILGDLS